jgi:hypothetical protein
LLEYREIDVFVLIEGGDNRRKNSLEFHDRLP